MLKPLTQLLLSLCRQATESRIILQCALLLSGREIFVASQPIPSVALLLWMSLRRPLYLGPWRLGWMFLLSRPEDSSLGRAGEGNRHRNRQTGDRHESRSVSPPRHCCSFFKLCPYRKSRTRNQFDAGLRIGCDILLQIQIVK